MDYEYLELNFVVAHIHILSEAFGFFPCWAKKKKKKKNYYGSPTGFFPWAILGLDSSKFIILIFFVLLLSPHSLLYSFVSSKL